MPSQGLAPIYRLALAGETSIVYLKGRRPLFRSQARIDDVVKLVRLASPVSR